MVSTARLVSGSSGGLPESEMVHGTEVRHHEPELVTDGHNVGEAVQVSSGVDMDTSLQVSGGGDDRLNVPLPQVMI